MGKNETKNYVGGSGMDDMELDERDIQLMEESRKEGKKKLFIALGAIVLAVIVVVIYIVVRKNMTGKSESEDLIKTYMEGLEEADLDKVESVMDPDTIDSDSSKDLVTVFQTYKENNIEYTVSYIPWVMGMWQSPAIWRQSAALYMERPRRKQVYQRVMSFQLPER